MKNKFIKQFAEENLKQATYNGTQFGDNIESGDQVLVMKVSGIYVDKKYIDQVNYTNKGTDYAYTTRLKEDKYLILKSWEKNHQRYIDWTPFMYVVDASELIFESPWSDEVKVCTSKCNGFIRRLQGVQNYRGEANEIQTTE